MNNTVFSLGRVTFAYPQGEPVLRELSLELHEGERLCVLGANGCGKSTLLRLLTGLIFPQSGSFTAFGEEINQKAFNETRAREYHRRVGFVFQNSEAQLFCSTVSEELAFGPLQLGLDAQAVRQRIAETVALLGIGHLLGKAPFRLSGGEKKKVAIAGVLIMNPDVLIMDEPTGSLDPRSLQWLLGLLRTLAEAGKTLVLATHNLELAPELCDRALLFDEDHTLAADGPVRGLLRDAELLKRVNLVGEGYRAPQD